MPVEQYGFRDMHAKMDDHVKRESNRPKPRRTNGAPGENTSAPNSGHRTVTKGVRVKRGEVVEYPYGGKPYETYTRELTASKPWKQEIARKHDLIGQRVVRDLSQARPGCTLITVQATEATALAFKIKAALNGGQINDASARNTAVTASPLYQARTTRVLQALDYALDTGKPVTLGVFTRGELKIIGSQRTAKKHITRHVRNLEAKLAGRR